MTDEDVSVEIQAGRRGYLAHEALLDFAPASVAANGKSVIEISAFVSRRYLRNARPELFDRRLREADALKKLEDLLAHEVPDGHIFDVLFDIEPNGEDVSDADPYVVTVYDVLKDEFDVFAKAESTRRSMDAVSDAIREILLACGGIEVEAIHVVGRSEIDIRTRERLCSLEIVWPRFDLTELDDEVSDV